MTVDFVPNSTVKVSNVLRETKDCTLSKFKKPDTCRFVDLRPLEKV